MPRLVEARRASARPVRQALHFHLHFRGGRARHRQIRAGYGEHRYFRIGNNGFALVTRVERLASNGAPDQHYRWRPPDATEPFSLFKFILGLVWPEPGYYRLIVFIATPEMFSNTGREVTSQDASRKLSLGVAVLPRSLSDQPFTNDHHCFALIYEFEKAKPESVPVLLDPQPIHSHRASGKSCYLGWNSEVGALGGHGEIK